MDETQEENVEVKKNKGNEKGPDGGSLSKK
jgi:hypothetical protein